MSCWSTVGFFWQPEVKILDAMGSASQRGRMEIIPKTESLDQIQLIPKLILKKHWGPYFPTPQKTYEDLNHCVGKHQVGFAVESCQGESKDEDSTLQARFGQIKLSWPTQLTDWLALRESSRISLLKWRLLRKYVWRSCKDRFSLHDPFPGGTASQFDIVSDIFLSSDFLPSIMSCWWSILWAGLTTVVSFQNLEGSRFLRPKRAKKMPLLLTIFGRIQKVPDFPKSTGWRTLESKASPLWSRCQVSSHLLIAGGPTSLCWKRSGSWVKKQGPALQYSEIPFFESEAFITLAGLTPLRSCQIGMAVHKRGKRNEKNKS